MATATAALATIALTGCMTGPRPTLRDPVEVDDPAAEAVLGRLDRAGDVDFTATYDIVPTATGQATAATVTRSGTTTHVTIGDVDYIVDSSSSRTCGLGEAACVEGIDDARVSNLNITHRFWSTALASRLATDSTRNIAPGVESTEPIAGQPATCVALPLAGGTASYCALDVGPLARYSGADVAIELTSFIPG